MTESAIPESELQAWLTLKAEQREIPKHITNLASLNHLAGHRRRGDRTALRRSADACQRAIRICRMLSEAELLTDNRSVAPRTFKQMRPDLTLRADGGNYILVELKTRKSSERQGVQELLAYSAAMRVQHPHVSDFCYIVIARHWDELLRFSVLSLILDGKHVLPLGCQRKSDGDFALHIKTDLFDFDESPYYSPIYAMSAQVLGAPIPRPPSPLRTRQIEYFKRLATDAAAECERVAQSGFAMVWANPVNSSTEAISLVLATVNQNWRHSDHTPDEYRNLGAPLSRLDDVIERKADTIRRDHLKQVLDVHGRAPDRIDKAQANEAASRVYVDSMLSFEILEQFRHRDDEDNFLKQGGFWSCFDSSSMPNLWSFFRYIEDHRLSAGRLILFSAIGDLGDYVEAGDEMGECLQPRTFFEFSGLIDSFDRHKNRKLLLCEADPALEAAIAER